MLLDRISRSLLMTGTRAVMVSSALTAALVFTPAANSTDLDYSQASASAEGHFVRIGLGKSIVIRLPADAKDVIVGDPAVVDAVVRTKNTAYLFARAVGQTNIFFFDALGRQIMNIDLEVALDMLALQKLIKRTYPGSRITVDTVGVNVVLGGTAANAVEAAAAEAMAGKFAGDPTKVVNTMKIAGGDQVMLKVRIVEIQRKVLKDLGINIQQLAFDAGKFAFDLSTANPVSTLVGGLGGSTGGGGSVGFNGTAVDFSATFRALENNGIVRTLAEPNLTAVSGGEARFLAGGQVPVCGSLDEFRRCVTTFKDFGVSLGFKPVVLDEGRISLAIQTEVSDVGPPINGVISFVTRSAATVIEVPSGGSMMLAGLIQNTDQHDLDGTPGLKDVPVLGSLFRSRRFQSSETELVVIVTPYLVNPVNEKQLATPADHFNLATDRQAILFGHLNKVYGGGQHPDGVYHGNVGFIIE